MAKFSGEVKVNVPAVECEVDLVGAARNIQCKVRLTSSLCEVHSEHAIVYIHVWTVYI